MKTITSVQPADENITNPGQGKNIWLVLRKVMKYSFLACGLAAGVSAIQYKYFESTREKELKERITEIESQYYTLGLHIDSLEQVLVNIEFRDDHMYRLVLGVEPLDPSIRKGAPGDPERYTIIREKRIALAELITQLNSKVNKLRRKLYIESLSQDELMQLTAERKKLYSAIPDIQPISIKDLKGLTSSFGLRLHPLYEIVMMHTGIDLAAAEGADVYATADGEIAATDTTHSSHGRMITIDHGFGYQTRYAHLAGFDVTPGERVKRGDRIGFVGNTGLSTGPHLHYEVLAKGIQIDPVNYFFHQLNASENEVIPQFASIPGLHLGN